MIIFLFPLQSNNLLLLLPARPLRNFLWPPAIMHIWVRTHIHTQPVVHYSGRYGNACRPSPRSQTHTCNWKHPVRLWLRVFFSASTFGALLGFGIICGLQERDAQSTSLYPPFDSPYERSLISFFLSVLLLPFFVILLQQIAQRTCWCCRYHQQQLRSLLFIMYAVCPVSSVHWLWLWLWLSHQLTIVNGVSFLHLRDRYFSSFFFVFVSSPNMAIIILLYLYTFFRRFAVYRTLRLWWKTCTPVAIR